MAATQTFLSKPCSLLWNVKGNGGFLAISGIRYSSSDGSVRKSGKVHSLTSLKRGTGYRSSFSGTVATVFGSLGCLGNTVVNRLGKSGAQIVIPYHKDHSDFRQMKLAGDLGQVLFTPFYLKDEESIQKSMKYSNVVFNFIGKHIETRNFSFEDYNIHAPRQLAKIARESGAERFFHVSHLNARENPQKCFLPGGSRWLKTKWLGEQAVLEEFPDATILRPTDFYGNNDKYFSHYLSTARFTLKGENLVITLHKRGDHTVKRPLFVKDITDTIMICMEDDDTKGQIVECFGPNAHLLGDVVDHMLSAANYDLGSLYRPMLRKDLRFSPAALLKFWALGKIPIGFNVLTRNLNLDMIERMSTDDRSEGHLNMFDLGVKGTKFEDVAQEFAHLFKIGIHGETETYWKHIDDIPIVSKMNEQRLLSGMNFN